MLKLCELAARNAVPDIDDVQDHTMALMQRSFDSFASKMKYLLTRASAQWTVGFEKALDTSHSMRVTKIDPDKKEARRDSWPRVWHADAKRRTVDTRLTWLAT